MGLQGGLRCAEGPDRQLHPGLGLRHRPVHGGQGVDAALDGLQLQPVRKAPAAALQGLDPVVGRGHVQAQALHSSILVSEVRLIVAGHQLPDLLHLGLELVLLRQIPIHRPDQTVQLLRRSPQLRHGLLQLGKAAGLVVPAGVELLFQLTRRVGEGGVLLPGGNKGGDPPFQGGALVHRQPGLADIGAALEDILGNPQKGLPTAGGGEEVHRGGGVFIHGGESPHGGVGPGCAAGDGDLPLGQGEVYGAVHGAAAPGLVAPLVRSRSAVPGVQAVEHDPQEGGPGGFARLVGGLDDVETRLQVQRLVFQPPKCGGKPFDLHGALLSLHI